ncbi:hypothetical protein O6H91_Y072900 [Diphasiastrum complanatum]|nr:hypothetical protein O6H91_Y072900 [Diphasiastrum complanatum]KAJ7297211.1 hypothetical protein O6H91_Y072900 [Diphasiastrum complanatum]
MEEVLPPTILVLILSKAGAHSCARAACVGRTWRCVASEDSLWISFCQRDFELSAPLDPAGAPCSSHKAAYEAWRTGFKVYPMALVLRAKQCWDGIRSWAVSNFPDAYKSLLPGASEEEIEEAEEKLGWRLPTSVRLLYRFCNGQELPDESNDYQVLYSENDNYVGILGGYSFYEYYVNMQLFPLSLVVKMSQRFLPRLKLPTGSKRIIIAACCNLNKFFFLDCDDGMVYVGTRNLQTDGEMMSCAPFHVSNVLGDDESGFQKDAMLRWLEEYRNCLLNGTFHVHQDENMCSISLFPEDDSLCTEAVTCGVQVRCSAVFVPEHSTLKEENDKYMFSYRVRMRLLPSRAGHSMESCQLSCRHWVIKADDQAVNEVRGEAVVGMYPLLQENGEEFVYESCTPLRSCSGSIEGDFTFVPGSLGKPKGAEFIAIVARVPLLVPRYIF